MMNIICDLCKKEHTPDVIIKLKDEFQIDAVSDLCQSCFDDIYFIYNYTKNKNQYISMVKCMIRLSDRIHGV